MAQCFIPKTVNEIVVFMVQRAAHRFKQKGRSCHTTEQGILESVIVILKEITKKDAQAVEHICEKHVKSLKDSDKQILSSETRKDHFIPPGYAAMLEEIGTMFLFLTESPSHSPYVTIADFDREMAYFICQLESLV